MNKLETYGALFKSLLWAGKCKIRVVRSIPHICTVLHFCNKLKFQIRLEMFSLFNFAIFFAILFIIISIYYRYLSHILNIT